MASRHFQQVTADYSFMDVLKETKRKALEVSLIYTEAHCGHPGKQSSVTHCNVKLTRHFVILSHYFVIASHYNVKMIA